MSGFASVEEAEAELDVVVARIRTTEEHRSRLFDRRREIFRYLIAQGRKQAAIARRAGVSSMVVALALKDNGAGPAKTKAKSARKKTSKA